MAMGDAHQQQAAGAAVAVGIDAMDRYRLLAGDGDGGDKDGGGGITPASSVRALIHQVLGHPSIFAGFAELASTPAVRDALVGRVEGEAALRTLELFAFGTYSDYVKVRYVSTVLDFGLLGAHGGGGGAIR